MILSALCGSRAEGQTSLTGQVLLNQKLAFDAADVPTPNAGTYLIAMSGRLQGEYILRVEAPEVAQTVHLIVSSNQYDGAPTIQMLDNHSYGGHVTLSNFRLMLPSGDAIVTYLLMDVNGFVASDHSTVVRVQYQGGAGWISGLASAGGTIPTGLQQVGGTVLAVNESSVGIGTASPSARLEVNGGVKITPGSNGNLTFQDGTTQSTAWTGSSSNISAGTNAAFGRVTVGNSSPDGDPSAAQGIVFADTLRTTSGSDQWTHGAIFSVGETGYNGDLVFATDGDFQENNNPSEKMRIMYDGKVGIGTSSPQSLLHLRSSFWDPAAASQPIGNGNLTIEGVASSRSPSTGAALTFAVPANTDGTNTWDHGRIVVTPDNANNGDANGRMYLQTRYHSGNNWLWNNNLTLNSQGSVGVGTTGPQQQLSVQQSMNVDQADTNPGTWDFSLGSHSGEGFGSARTGGAPNRFGLDFYTGGLARASITNGGFLGIGTNAPSERLEVNGNIKLTANGNKLVFPDGTSQSTASVSTFSQSNGNTAIAGPVTLNGVMSTNQEIQSLGTNAGFRVASASWDVVNAAPWYGLGLSNLGWEGGNSTVQLAGYFGLNFQTQSGQMVMRSNGNVGVGTATPQAKFDVNGDIRISSNSGKLIFPDGSVQTTANSSTLSQSNGNTTVNGPLFVGGGSGTASVQGSYITWNQKTGGTGETDFINHRGGGTGGFAFYNTGGDGSSKDLLAYFDGSNDANAARLEINGNLRLTANSGSHLIFPDGTSQATAWTGVVPAQDYADSVDVTGARNNYEPGDVLTIDTANARSFRKTNVPYSTLVAGVYSTKPGLLGKRQQEPDFAGAEVPLALNGIVPVKVTTENGPIHVGDLLVCSSVPGTAMKGTDREKLPGAVLGKALGALAAGTGTIEVLISLQ